jgi:hypothetical protein
LRLKRTILFAVFTFIIADYAFANDYTIVTSKAYVDTKQSKIPAETNGYLATHSGTAGTFGTPVNPATFQSAIPAGTFGENASVVTYDDAAGTVQERWILGEGTQELDDDEAAGLIFFSSRLRTNFSGNYFGTLMDDTEVTQEQAKNSLITGKLLARVLQTKQDTIPRHEANEADSLLTDSATTGTVQKRAIYNDTAANYNASTQSTYIPTMGAVMSAVTSGANAALPTGTTGTVVTYNGTTNGVQQFTETAIYNGSTTYAAATDANKIPTAGAVAVGLNSKQNIIAASEWVDAYENPIPGVVISTDSDGIVEQRMILDNVAQPISSNAIANLVANGNDGNGGNGTVTHDIHDNSVTATDVNASIPTTTMTIAIANAAANTAANNATATLPWATAEQNATGAYNTTFADSGTNVWPTADADKVVKGQTFANAMATKQNKIPARAANATASVLTDSTTDGFVAKLPIMTVEENGNDLLSEWVNNDNMIPTIGAVANAIQPVPWNKAEQNATGAYSTTFAASGTNVWPTADADKVVKGTTLANALATKQNKISGHAANAADSVLTDSTTDGVVGKKIIYRSGTAEGDNLFGDWVADDTQIPTIGAVSAVIENSSMPWNTAEQNATGAYSTTFAASGTNVWPTADADTFVRGQTFANALALKQNKITTGLVEFNNNDELMVRAIVATNAAGTALNGNTIGILDYPTIADDEGNLSVYNDTEYSNGAAAQFDNFVPTVRAVANALHNIWDTMPDISGLQTKIPARATKVLNTDTTFAPSVVTNTTTAGTVGQMAIVTYEYADGVGLGLGDFDYRDDMIPTTKLVAQEFNLLSSIKQDKIPKSGYSWIDGNAAYNTNAATDINSWLSANVAGTGLVTRTADDGHVGERKIFEESNLSGYSSLTGNNKLIADISIPTVGAMMSAISSGANAALPTGTTGTVVTYNGTTNGVQQFTETAIYNGSTTYAAATDANKIATAGFVETKQTKKVCVEWPDGVEHTDANCWLWQLPD